MPNKLLALFKSRKFYAALVGLALVVLRALRPDFPLSDEQISTVALLLIAYIGGIALEDGLRARNTI